MALGTGLVSELTLSVPQGILKSARLPIVALENKPAPPELGVLVSKMFPLVVIVIIVKMDNGVLAQPESARINVPNVLARLASQLAMRMSRVVGELLNAIPQHKFS